MGTDERLDLYESHPVRGVFGLVFAVMLTALTIGATSARASGGSLSGRAVYADMTPASRVLVFVAPVKGTGVVTTYETLTNAAGEWAIAAVPAGEYSVALVVVPASGVHETRESQIVTIHEGQELSLGTLDVGTPTVSEAKTLAEIRAERAARGTLTVVVKTAEGVPPTAAMLAIQDSEGGSDSGVPPSGVVSETVPTGAVTVTVTDTPPDSLSSSSESAEALVTANATTTVALTLPAGAPLPVPGGTAAQNSERDLAYLNAERARWGLPAGIALKPSWSQACAAHDVYLADNNRLEHPEDSSLPGASPGGEWAGLHSILAEGATWTAQANPWEDAPIHLDQLFSPGLAVVGIDGSHYRECTTTWPGIGAVLPGGTITTYPGDGTSGFPPAELAAESPFVPGKFVGVPEGKVAGRELFVYEESGLCPLFCSWFGAPEIESVSLIGPAGKVEVRTVGGETPEVGSYLTGAVIIPVKPLAADANYTAEVTLAPKGTLPAEHHRWTFRTGPANPGGSWFETRSAALVSRRVISQLRVTPERLDAKSRRTPPSRAVVTYRDSGSGTVRFAVLRLTVGHRQGRLCVKVAHARRGERCRLATRVYSFAHHDRVGLNQMRLTANYSRELAAGQYRLMVSTPSGSVATASFSVS